MKIGLDYYWIMWFTNVKLASFNKSNFHLQTNKDLEWVDVKTMSFWLSIMHVSFYSTSFPLSSSPLIFVGPVYKR